MKLDKEDIFLMVAWIAIFVSMAILLTGCGAVDYLRRLGGG